MVEIKKLVDEDWFGQRQLNYCLQNDNEVSSNNNNNVNRNMGSGTNVKRKQCRRSNTRKNCSKNLNIMYANIQGFRGKKTSLQFTMNALDVDVALLAETMVQKVSLVGCQCITPKSSIGQNVAIVFAGKCCNYNKMKLYEPNETINMIGFRLDLQWYGVRIFTAHLKQQSTSSRDEVSAQFVEIQTQFRCANFGREPMIMIFDANVHVGSNGIKTCKDQDDWGGRQLMSMIRDEGLTLLNDLELCSGTVTRVDPRNGHESTIDLAVCNTFMLDKVVDMDIDEIGQWKLKKYGKKTTETDHNTVMVKLKLDKGYIEKDTLGNVQKRYNVRNDEARSLMQENINADSSFDELFSKHGDVNIELDRFMLKWNNVMKKSFQVVKPSRNTRKGVDPDVKALLKEEKRIRNTVQDKAEKGRRLAVLQREIGEKISANVSAEIESKVQGIIKSDKPQSKVFGVRRNMKKSLNIGFPLKDKHGTVQVSKHGIDGVINQHFKKVFAQNGIPDGQVWHDYWEQVDEVFSVIDRLTINKYCRDDEPTEKEILSIISQLETNKATFGPLSIDLVKLGGVRIFKVIHRCILTCFRNNILPEMLRNEKMVLLLKARGIIDIINDYRGIFLRNIIICIYQKWLYSKNADYVDENGSEYACGGRKERSGLEALLIVKLVQDFCKWTKQPVVIKFLDVEKFFDSMNFKLALIHAYLSGVRDRFWQCYKTLNEQKTCIPHIASGTCSPINVENVFVQGSCDAVLVAWPLMDAESKRTKDCFSTNFYIENIQLNRLSFVDDLIQFVKIEGVMDKTVDCEVFEKLSRLHFKVVKCKVMPMNTKQEILDLMNDIALEIVENHEYLGTLCIKADELEEPKNDAKTCMGKRASRRTDTINLPPILVFHVKRFGYKEEWMTKNQMSITYPETIRSKNDQGNNVDYELYGSINHKGTYMKGHYTATCKDKSGEWFHCNDSKVNKTKYKIQKDAYLLFYKQSNYERKVHGDGEQQANENYIHKNMLQKEKGQTVDEIVNNSEDISDAMEDPNCVGSNLSGEKEIANGGIEGTLQDETKLEAQDEMQKVNNDGEVMYEIPVIACITSQSSQEAASSENGNDLDLTGKDDVTRRSKRLKKPTEKVKAEEVQLKSSHNTKKDNVCHEKEQEDDTEIIQCEKCEEWTLIENIEYQCSSCNDELLQEKQLDETLYHKRRYEEGTEKHKAEKAMLNKRITELEKKLALKDQAKKNDITVQDRNEVKLLKDQNRAYKNEISELELKVKQGKRELDKNNKKMDNLEMEKTKKIEEKKKLEEKILSGQTESSTMRTRLIISERESKEQQSEILELKEQLKTAADQLTTIKKKYENYEGDHGNNEMTDSSPIDENEEATVAVDPVALLKKEISKLKKESKKWENEAWELRNNLNVMVNEKLQLVTTIRHLTDNLDLLKRTTVGKVDSNDDSNVERGTQTEQQEECNRSLDLEDNDEYRCIDQYDTECEMTDDDGNDSVNLQDREQDDVDCGSKAADDGGEDLADPQRNTLSTRRRDRDYNESQDHHHDETRKDVDKINEGNDAGRGKSDEICPFYMDQDKRCWFGNKCRNIHPPALSEEILGQQKEIEKEMIQEDQKHDKPKAEICKFYVNPDMKCWFGQRCRNLHPEKTNDDVKGRSFHEQHNEQDTGSKRNGEQNNNNIDKVSGQFKQLKLNDQIHFLDLAIKKIKRYRM